MAGDGQGFGADFVEGVGTALIVPVGNIVGGVQVDDVDAGDVAFDEGIMVVAANVGDLAYKNIGIAEFIGDAPDFVDQGRRRSTIAFEVKFFSAYQVR